MLLLPSPPRRGANRTQKHRIWPKGFDLTGKVSLVTGSNGGIGFSMADAMAEAGADNLHLGHQPQKTEDAATRLRQHGRKVPARSSMSGTGRRSRGRLCRTLRSWAMSTIASRQLGRVGPRQGSILEMDYDREWRRVMRRQPRRRVLHLPGAQAHGQWRGKGGSLVAMASTAAVEGARGPNHYGASKAASPPWCAPCRSSWRATDHGQLDPARLDRDRDDPERLQQPEVRRQRRRAFPERRWGVGADFNPIAVYLARQATGTYDGARLRHRWRLYPVLGSTTFRYPGRHRQSKTTLPAALAFALMASSAAPRQHRRSSNCRPSRRRPRPPRQAHGGREDRYVGYYYPK